jgi:hypothetical protein
MRSSKLTNWERSKTMKDSLIVFEDGTPVLNADIAYQIAHFERLMKSVKQREDNLRAEIQAAMEAHDIKKIDTDDITITYVPATDRETFDSKKFRADNPDMYDNYVKISHVKPNVRVKVK